MKAILMLTVAAGLAAGGLYFCDWYFQGEPVLPIGNDGASAARGAPVPTLDRDEVPAERPPAVVRDESGPAGGGVADADPGVDEAGTGEGGPATDDDGAASTEAPGAAGEPSLREKGSGIAADLLGTEEPVRRAELLRQLIREDPGSPEVLDVVEQTAARVREDGDVGLEWEALSFVFFGLEDGERRERVRERLDEITDRIIFSPRPGPYSELYRIQSGDSLEAVAARYNCPVDTICRMNGIRNRHMIRQGERIKVLHGANEAEVPVGPGDTLDSIAAAAGMTARGLMELNALEHPEIEPGDRLRVRRSAFEIRIDKSDFHLTVLWHGRYARRYPIGTGADGRTPSGRFTVEDRIKNPPWWKDGQRIPAGDPRNILGSMWIGFEETDFVSGIGIHGTTEPDTIGTESSAGCIRMHDADVEELALLTPRGTPVIITD